MKVVQEHLDGGISDGLKGAVTLGAGDGERLFAFEINLRVYHANFYQSHSGKQALS